MAQARRHQYEVTTVWGGEGSGTTRGYTSYSREYRIESPGKATLAGSADPAAAVQTTRSKMIVRTPSGSPTSAASARTRTGLGGVATRSVDSRHPLHDSRPTLEPSTPRPIRPDFPSAIVVYNTTKLRSPLPEPRGSARGYARGADAVGVSDTLP